MSPLVLVLLFARLPWLDQLRQMPLLVAAPDSVIYAKIAENKLNRTTVPLFTDKWLKKGYFSKITEPQSTKALKMSQIAAITESQSTNMPPKQPFCSKNLGPLIYFIQLASICSNHRLPISFTNLLQPHRFIYILHSSARTIVYLPPPPLYSIQCSSHSFSYFRAPLMSTKIS